MQVGDFEFEVLVNGNPVREYQHNGQTFIEARKGTEYSLRIRSHSHDRVEAVISVDGISIMDGKPGDINTPGYVYDSHASPSPIPGWRVDDNTTARFKFGAKKKGYAKKATGDDNNRGIIACAFFREKQWTPTVVYKDVHHHHYDKRRYNEPWAWPHTPYFWTTTSGSDVTFTTTASDDMNTAIIGVANEQAVHNSGGVVTRLATTKLGTAKAEPAFVGVMSVQDKRSIATEFGPATDFAVSSTSFTRASSTADVAIQFLYRSREELQALGVDLRGKPKVAKAPMAFPANSVGCPLPAGWAERNLT